MPNSQATKFVDHYVPGKNATVELKNGKFIDVVNGRYFSDGMRVIIQGDKILAMPGLAGEPSNIPADYSIDLQGKTVMPGLFNTHCHTSFLIISLVSTFAQTRLASKYRMQQIDKNMAECLAHGITTLRDCANNDLNEYHALSDRISKGVIPGPRIYQSVLVGPWNSYGSSHMGLMERLTLKAFALPAVDYASQNSGSVIFPVDASESQVRDAVNRAIDERGAAFIKIGDQPFSNQKVTKPLNRMTPAQLEACTDQARKRGLKTTMHHVTVDSLRRAVKHGVYSIAHLPGDAALTEDDINEFVRVGCIIEPTYSIVGYGLFWRESIKGGRFYDDPDLVALTEFRNRTWSALADEFYLPEISESFKQGLERLNRGQFKIMDAIDMKPYMVKWLAGDTNGIHAMSNLRMLYDANARMGCGNDGGAGSMLPSTIKYEIDSLDLLLNNGKGKRKFDGANALRFATLDSAVALGIEKDFGSIQTGKVADLAIIDGDPLTDLHLIGSCVAALFLDGQLRVDNCGLQVEQAKKV